MALKFLLILIILGFWFSGCKRNPAPEVRNLLKDTKIGRLDLDLFRLDTVIPDWGTLQKNTDVIGIPIQSVCCSWGEPLILISPIYWPCF